MEMGMQMNTGAVLITGSIPQHPNVFPSVKLVQESEQRLPTHRQRGGLLDVCVKA